MKMLVDSKNEGLLSLIGKKVRVFCMNYIYVGKLVGVNTRDIKLEDAFIVYETGELSAAVDKDAQKLTNALYIRLNSVESYSER